MNRHTYRCTGDSCVTTSKRLNENSNYRYKLELIDSKWLVTQMAYKSVTDELVKVEVPQDASKMLRSELIKEQDRVKTKKHRFNESVSSYDAPDFFEYKHRNERVRKLLPSNVIHVDPVHAEVVRRERDQLLHRAIKQLLPSQQRLIWAHYFEGIPFAEIATREGVTASAISHQHNRAKASLKKILLADHQQIT